jgi:vinylacetyl-CoA delta-isomerase (EC 5.3.3.3)/4-hydroxybutyryl-CoA dehydratase (EC 4.2.1.-)
MALMTKDEYIDSLRHLKRRVFIMGQEVENPVDHPLVRPSLNACAMTYELAQRPEHAGLMQAISNLTGQTINRFTHLHQSTGDLVAKVKMQRLLGQTTGCCFQRCVGMDAFNALDSVTFEMDQALGTAYHARFPPLPAARTGARPGSGRRDDRSEGRPAAQALTAGRP